MKLGLDPGAFGALSAWLTDGYSRGLLDTRRTGRIIRWNDAERLKSLAETVARREGPGRYLGDGSFREARRAGGGAQRLLAQVAGVDWPGIDPRTHKGAALSFPTGHYRWDPMRSLECPISFQNREVRSDGGIAGGASSWEGLARSLVRARILTVVAEMAGLCHLPVSLAPALDMTDVCELLYAVTGEVFSPSGLESKAARLLEEEMNLLVRDGVGMELLRPPERFFQEPVSEGPFRGEVLKEGDFVSARGLYYEEIRKLRDTPVPEESNRAPGPGNAASRE
jgi:aldehyde:ferredoxin oxidoreductase